MKKQPNMTEAFELLKKFNESEALLRHGLNVSYVMRHFARLNGEDEEKWAVIGLLHDLDYEKYPDEHCKKVVEILNEENVDDEYIHAVASHGYGICSDVEPTHLMEKILFTIDELTGLINAGALMRPSKSCMDMEVKSIAKKFKTPSFAAGVDRNIITKGCEMLGMDLNYIMEETLLGMREAETNVSKYL